jgi:hypothetical protein
VEGLPLRAVIAVALVGPGPLLAQSPPPPAPAPVSAQATTSKTEVTVGERITVVVKAVGPAGTTYDFPAQASEETFGLSTPAPPPGDAPATPEPGTHTYEASFYSLGEATLPPIPVRYRLPDGTEGETATQPLRLKVASLLPKDEEQRKLADIRGPGSVSIGRAFWVTLVVLGLVAAGLVTWLLRRRRPSGAISPAHVPEIAPDVEALGALDALSSSNLLARGEYRTYYIELMTVAKRYLERRLGAPVLEMTSAETLAFLRGHAHGGELLPLVRDVADSADRIKFARGEGAHAEADRHLSGVRGLVTSLEARLRPPPEGAEGRAA